MKILVTGGCGFIGSNYVLRQVLDNNNEVLNVDKLTYAGNIKNLDKLKGHSKYKFKNVDICDSTSISKQIVSFKPDAIVHFAAESHVDRSIEKPMDFINTNILGTANLLHQSMNYLKGNKIKFRFIHVSTDEVFGSLSKEGFFTEKTSYDPSSPYSASKASSDHLVRAWNRTYNFPSIITNCSNNYGPYQFPEKLIPLMLANCLDEKPLPIYGEGNNIRDWLFVEDHCKAIDKVLIKGVIGETYNIGGNNEITNLEIVKKICKLLDDLKPRKNNASYLDLISFVTDRPGHDFRYAIDSSKIKKQLNWDPQETFNSGILKTIKWYLENEDWWRQIQKETYNQTRLGL